MPAPTNRRRGSTQPLVIDEVANVTATGGDISYTITANSTNNLTVSEATAIQDFIDIEDVYTALATPFTPPPPAETENQRVLDEIRELERLAQTGRQAPQGLSYPAELRWLDYSTITTTAAFSHAPTTSSSGRALRRTSPPREENTDVSFRCNDRACNCHHTDPGSVLAEYARQQRCPRCELSMGPGQHRHISCRCGTFMSCDSCAARCCHPGCMETYCTPGCGPAKCRGCNLVACNEHCEEQFQGCSHCERYYCSSCRVDASIHRCLRSSLFDFDAYIRNPFIAEYNCSPRFEFQKKPWDGELYLGVELEMNFHPVHRPQLLRFTADKLGKNAIWKHDGSIGDGAELIFAPTTIAKFKEYKLRELFKNLQEKFGCDAEATGMCGLHIHTNRHCELFSPPSGDVLARKGYGTKRVVPKLFYPLERMRFFLHRHRAKIFKLSRRSAHSFERWCKIPLDYPSSGWNEKYVALRSTPNTAEFRIFRGTLSPDVFTSCLEWCDAFVRFAFHHKASFFLDPAKTAGKRDLKTWNGFIEYTESQNRYFTLIDYLKSLDLHYQ